MPDFLRININLPTLKANVYSKLTGGKLHDVLRGIEEAVKLGFIQLSLTC